MAEPQHILSAINPINRRADCSSCGSDSPIGYKGTRNGRQRWQCHWKINTTQRLRLRPYKSHKKDTCDMCGFIPEHPCQLDVDHIDGNKQNENPNNFQTLCANCHRLKTFKERRSNALRFRKGYELKVA